jgi:hypothetical protein
VCHPNYCAALVAAVTSCADPALKKRHQEAFQIFSNLPIGEVEI